MCQYVSVCVTICKYVSVCVSMSLHVYVCACVSIHVSLWLCICMIVCARLCVLVWFHISFHILFHVSVCVYVYITSLSYKHMTYTVMSTVCVSLCFSGYSISNQIPYINLNIKIQILFFNIYLPCLSLLPCKPLCIPPHTPLYPFIPQYLHPICLSPPPPSISLSLSNSTPPSFLPSLPPSTLPISIHPIADYICLCTLNRAHYWFVAAIRLAALSVHTIDCRVKHYKKAYYKW